MSSAHVQRRINAPVEQVWAAATDIAGACGRLSGVLQIELLTKGPFGVGTRWRETREAGGTAATEELVVAECEPPRRFVTDATSGDAVFRTVTTFAAARPTGTDVEVDFNAPPPNVAGRLVGAILGGLAARTALATLHRDLDDLAAWCEGRRSGA
jgi:hypothetical protein